MVSLYGLGLSKLGPPFPTPHVCVCVYVCVCTYTTPVLPAYAYLSG